MANETGDNVIRVRVRKADIDFGKPLTIQVEWDEAAGKRPAVERFPRGPIKI